jgi:hypothetical protein
LPASGVTFPLGTTTVTCTATDAPRNTGSASFTVTVVDIIAPVVTAPGGGAMPDLTVAATRPVGAEVTFAVAGSDVVDGALAPTCTPPSGSFFPVGTTTVTCTATDAAGNTGSGSFELTVTPYVGPRPTNPPTSTMDPGSPPEHSSLPLILLLGSAGIGILVAAGHRPRRRSRRSE